KPAEHKRVGATQKGLRLLIPAWQRSKFTAIIEPAAIIRQRVYPAIGLVRSQTRGTLTHNGKCIAEGLWVQRIQTLTHCYWKAFIVNMADLANALSFELDPFDHHGLVVG